MTYLKDKNAKAEKEAKKGKKGREIVSMNTQNSKVGTYKPSVCLRGPGQYSLRDSNTREEAQCQVQHLNPSFPKHSNV